MNALIYCEHGNLWIRKPNGLEWEHKNVDRPELGFEYEVLIYDDIECKVEKWNDEVELEQQDRLPYLKLRRMQLKRISVMQNLLMVSV